METPEEVEVIVGITLPVNIRTFRAVAAAIRKLHGEGLLMRQVGNVMQIYKPTTKEQQHVSGQTTGEPGDRSAVAPGDQPGAKQKD